MTGIGAEAYGAAASSEPYGSSPAAFGAWLDKTYPGKILPASSGHAQYPGKTLGAQFQQFYAEQHKAHPTLSVADLEGAFMILVGEVQLGSGAAAGAGAVANDTQAAGQGVVAGLNQYEASIANPLAAIGQFFSALTHVNTWIRLAKIVVGGTLLIFGLAHMTGASNAVTSVVKRVPLPV